MSDLTEQLADIRSHLLQYIATQHTNRPDILTNLSAAVERLQLAETELCRQNDTLQEVYLALAQACQNARDILDHAEDGYVITTIDGIIQDANHVLCDLLNIPWSFLVDKPLLLFLPLEVRPQFRHTLEQLARQRTPEPWYIQLQPRNAPPIDAHCTCTVLHDLHGQVTGACWRVQALHGRGRAQYPHFQHHLISRNQRSGSPDQHIAPSLKERSHPRNPIGEVQPSVAFLGVVAHEFRTPLTALLGYLDVLQSCVVRSDAQRNYQQHALDMVVIHARQLHRLVNNVFNLLQVVTGQGPHEYQSVDVSTLLHQVLMAIQSSPQRHAITIEEPSEPLFIYGDWLLLHQAVMNVVENALKYSPNNGRITIRFTQEGTMIHIAVADEGVGIPADAIAQLLQCQDQESNICTPHLRGVGIGLYLVHAIVTLHGGSVDVQSREGIGTTVTLVLPAWANTIDT